jgi:hypothetical protein
MKAEDDGKKGEYAKNNIYKIWPTHLHTHARRT